MSAPTATPVLAAGAVCWRRRNGKVEILLISRSRHNDISLPKGKVDPGETLPAAAVREIHEETGYNVSLGVPLGVTEYAIPSGRDKVVHYWAAEITPAELEKGRFRPNDEVESLEWATVAAARKRLSYVRDGDVLTRFADLEARGALDTFALIVLRHGKAVQPPFSGPDSARPLTERGIAQSKAIVNSLLAYGPKSVQSSTAVRCLQTVAPIAEALGTKVKETLTLSQELFDNDFQESDAAIATLVTKRMRKAKTTILCSHTPVLPVLLEHIGQQSGSETDQRLSRSGMLSTAEFSVVHLSKSKPDAGILAIETHSPLV